MNDIEKFSFFRTYMEGIERFKSEDSKMEATWAIVQYIYFDKEPIWTKKELERKEFFWVMVLPILNKSKKLAKSAKKKEEEN